MITPKSVSLPIGDAAFLAENKSRAPLAREWVVQVLNAELLSFDRQIEHKILRRLDQAATKVEARLHVRHSVPPKEMVKNGQLEEEQGVLVGGSAA